MQNLCFLWLTILSYHVISLLSESKLTSNTDQEGTC